MWYFLTSKKKFVLHIHMNFVRFLSFAIWRMYVNSFYHLQNIWVYCLKSKNYLLKAETCIEKIMTNLSQFWINSIFCDLLEADELWGNTKFYPSILLFLTYVHNLPHFRPLYWLFQIFTTYPNKNIILGSNILRNYPNLFKY